MVPPRKVQSTALQSPEPLKIIGMARCSGNDSIMPNKSRPQVAMGGGFHCSQLWRAAVKAPKADIATAMRPQKRQDAGDFDSAAMAQNMPTMMSA